MRLALALAFLLACSVDAAVVGSPDASAPPAVVDASAPIVDAAPDVTDAAPADALRGNGILRTSGRRIVDANGAPIALRGANLGNWLLLETWMTSLTGSSLDSDYEIRQKITTRFGITTQLFEDYQSRYLTDADLASFAAMGMSVVRLPFPYWKFESDAQPYVYDPAAFAMLDSFLRNAQKHGLYVILDFHGAPGGQSTNHSTGRIRPRAALWDRTTTPEYEQRLIALWTNIAKRYRGWPVVAGYDLVNEPEQGNTSATLDDLVAFYDRVQKAIRAVDPDHMFMVERLLDDVFFPGTTSAASRTTIRTWTNWMQSEHAYFQFGADGYDLDPTTITDAKIQSKVDYYRSMQTSWGVDVPLYIGELGWSHDNAFDLLPRQVAVYNSQDIAWTIWTAKTWTKSNMGVVYATSGISAPLNLDTATLAQVQAVFQGVGTANPNSAFVVNPGMTSLFKMYGAP